MKNIVDKAPKSDSPKLDEVIKANLSIVPESKDLKAFNDAYLAKNKDCARRTQAGLKSRQLIDPSSQAQNEKDLLAALEKADLKEATEGLEVLKLWKSDSKVKEQYLAKAKGRWPDATLLK